MKKELSVFEKAKIIMDHDIERNERERLEVLTIKMHASDAGMPCFTVDSDAAGVLIGNDSARFTVSNGAGEDGVTTVIIDVAKSLTMHDVPFRTVISGTDLNIYGSDSSTDEVLVTLSGQYGVFSAAGVVIIQRW